MTEIAIRDFRPDEDRGFVMSSWLKSYVGNRVGRWRNVEHRRAIEGHRLLVNRLLERSRVRVAVHPSAHHVILGWAAAEPDCLHYAYVKSGKGGDFRRRGICRALVSDAGHPKYFSHATEVGRAVLCRRFGMKESPGHALYPPLEVA